MDEAQMINISRVFTLSFERKGESVFNDMGIHEVLEEISKLSGRAKDDALAAFADSVMDTYLSLKTELNNDFIDFLKGATRNNGQEFAPVFSERVSRKTMKNDIFFWASRVVSDSERPIGEQMSVSKMTERIKNRFFVDMSRDSFRKSLQLTLEARERSRGRQGSGWRRVAHSGACAFCTMLATRGTVGGDGLTIGGGDTYYSERSATRTRQGKTYHDNCRCTAVPVENIYR